MKKTLLLLTCLLPLSLAAGEVAIEIDYGRPAKPLGTFWNSTGFSPADIVATPEMRYVLQDVGRLPAKGIKYVRPHYLLNAAIAKGLDTGQPIYDWAKLDGILDQITGHGLKMIFELMGFPSDGTGSGESQYDKNFQEQLVHQRSYFDNLANRDQLHRWKAFVTALALHLESRYGRDEVRTWFFETTNEPDLPHFWRYDIPTFLNYYDACSEGLKAADPALQFGGPGTARDLSDTFKALLAHCDTGKNHFTGEIGVRLDFISIHAKALPQPMIERELRIMDFVRLQHPRLGPKPFFNDEADPIVGWATPYWWERGPWYAAFVAQNIDLHQHVVIEGAGVNYRLLSNDHTFIGDWNQRTTHALFREQPGADGFVAIRKPVTTVMELIAQLGESHVDVNIPAELASYFGVLATRKGDALVLLVYNKTAMELVKGPKPEPDFEIPLMAQQAVQARLHIKGISGTTAAIREFRIDETHGNPHHEWLAMGKPSVLSVGQIARLKQAEAPALVRSEQINCPDHDCVLIQDAPSPSVSLLTIVPGPAGLR